MKPKHCYLLLCCIAFLFGACKEDANAPLRFYDTSYEVPMGGKRYLGLQSGNGDYSVEVGDGRIADAGVEYGWTGVPDGCQVYVEGRLTGITYVRVTDNATQETCVLPVKVVDNYLAFSLSHGSNSGLTHADPTLLSGIDVVYFVDNAARDAYLFRQGKQDAFTTGRELVGKGSYLPT